MVSEPFLWLSGSCGHLRRSSAALAFIRSSLSEASHRRHAHSTCNTQISTFCAFNCQTTGIERQNGQSWAKPNQERPKTASHAPPRASWSFCLMSTCRHASPRASTRRLYLPRASRAPHASVTRTYTPHAPAAASLPATSALGDVTLPRQPLTIDSDRWPLTLTIVKNFQPDLFCLVFRVDSDFELRFCIWGL